MNIQEKIIKSLESVVKHYGGDFAISLEHPKDRLHGDYSCNIALILSKELKKKPIELAQEIVSKLNESGIENISKIETAGPGFINFYLSNDFVQKQIVEIAKNGLQNFKKNGKQVLIEYTDPNAFKAFHIGHMMSNAIGESLSRIIENSGSEIKRICYPADVGLHIAKAIWATKANIADLPDESAPIQERTEFLGKMYVLGTKSYGEDPQAKAEIDSLNKVIYEKSDPTINEIYEKGRKWSLDHFEQLYKVLGTHFDEYIYESQVASIGLDLVKKNIDNGIFENSNGALVFKGEEFGLHTRVFVNSAGIPTYEAKDLGLNITKFKHYPKADQSIIITAIEQNDYFKVICQVLKLIDKANGDKTKHIGHGMMRFASGKMSSRTGNVITAEALLSEIKSMVEDKIKDRDYSQKEIEEISEIVAVGAIKYTILRSAIGGNIVFDSKASISFEGDSGPYLQYSAVRARSILVKAEEQSIGDDIVFRDSIHALENHIIKFDDVMMRANVSLSPHFIAGYLTELAGLFNSFYAEQVIVSKEDKYSPYFVYLTKAFLQVMQKGLALLGIRVPERM